MISTASPAIPITPNSHLQPPPPPAGVATTSGSTVPPENSQTTAPSRHSLYEGSSQYRHWRFSPEQLAKTRASLNAAAVKAIKDAFEADSVRFLVGRLIWFRV